jgi:hypothetical protein
MSFPRVEGRCPACGSTGTLFVGQGGYITCSLDRCPDPGVVADLLDRPRYHVIEFGEDGWAIQHEVTCFPNLLDCATHERVSTWLGALSGPPVPPGRYRVGDDLKLTAVTS